MRLPRQAVKYAALLKQYSSCGLLNLISVISLSVGYLLNIKNDLAVLERFLMAKSKKTPEVVKNFLQRISEGRSHASVCRDDDMPDWATVWRWTKEDPKFAAAFAVAKEERGNYYGEKVAEIALAVLAGKIKDSNAARVAIDGLKWTAARMASKNFGDRMQVEHSAESSYVDALRAVSERIEVDGLGNDSKLPQELRARSGEDADQGGLVH